MTAAAGTPTVLIAVAGNPNTGKSTLFNRLTGARQRVGNYPGVTVEKHTGTVRLGEIEAELIDLPGTYSLAPASADEEVVLDVLDGREEGVRRPDCVVCVVDATNLKRNLFLASQIGETGLPMVIALNMIDAAEEQGLRIDVPALAARLGVPVVATAAARDRGVADLLAAVTRAISEPQRMTPIPWPAAIVSQRAVIRDAMTVAAPAARGTEADVSRLLFDIDSGLAAKLNGGGLTAVTEAARTELRGAGIDPLRAEAELRYGHLAALLDGVVAERKSDVSPSDRIDRVLTHRVAGLAVFAALMFAVFASIYWLAGPLMDLVDALFGAAGGRAAAALQATPILQSLIVDGVIAGVGGVVIFLPQILILFLFIAVLEDSGYMARAAFLMDRAFSWCGLNGKSFVPMLSSFACAVPSLMATRAIEDPRARLTTILVTPLMSCSARLPVYVLMIGAFIQPTFGALGAATVLFAMHALGLVVAIPTAMALNRWILQVKRLPFVLEMPPYRMPRLRDVLWRMYRNGREFVVRAGTIILAFSIVIWALTYFPRPASVRDDIAVAVAAERSVDRAEADALLDGELGHRLASAYLEQSYIGRAGKAMQPLFAPAGFDWKITVGVLASFPARELIVSTLGIIYNLEGDDEEGTALTGKMRASTWPDGRPVYTPAVALAVMVFFAFCLQCASTVAVMARESSWQWAVFAFVYMTAFAWVGAVVTYQALSLFGGRA